MILKRIIDENGNEIYIKISFDDALKEEKSVLVFSSEEEEEEYDEALEEEEEEKEEVKEDLHDVFNNIKNIFNSKEVEETLNSTSDILNNVFSFSSNSKKEKTKSQKIISMLPFMDKEDLHELVNDILNGSEEYKDIPLQAIFPFLSKEDCDSLFLKSIEDPDSNGTERVKLTGCTFDELQLVNWEAKKLAEESIPFSFTGWEVLDTISPL